MSWTTPRSFQAEAYRVLRTNLHYANPDAPLRRILVTSAGPGEGKSTTVANLGVSMAQSERAVLLVDTDLRRPMSSTRCSGSRTAPGLSSYLAGDSCSTRSSRRRRSRTSRSWRAGRRHRIRPSSLGSRRMRDFSDAVSERFDTVVFDSPAGAGGERCVHAGPAWSDGVLLVVGSGKAAQVALRRAKEAILAVHGRIIGAVLNRFDASAKGYSRRYYDRTRATTPSAELHPEG